MRSPVSGAVYKVVSASAELVFLASLYIGIGYFNHVHTSSPTFKLSTQFGINLLYPYRKPFTPFIIVDDMDKI